MSLSAIIATGLFASSTVGWLSKYQEGQVERTAAIRQAQQLQLQSKYVQQTAGLKIAAQDYKAVHILSRIQAVAGAAGIESTEGSTAEVLETSAEEARINDMYTKYAANVQSTQLEYEADLTKLQGQESADIATINAITGEISSGIRAYGASELPGSKTFAKFGSPTLYDLLSGGTF